MNKKQQKNLIKALAILKAGIKTDDCRKWDGLFENNYNDTTSLIWELYKKAKLDINVFSDLAKNSKFLPTILVNALKLGD
jgi:hypothetical protein